MKRHKSAIILFTVLFAICTLAMLSCSIIRGLRTDGKYGPDIFSFEKREVDTIANGEVAFHFPIGKSADWIDTMHFSNAPHQCKYMTFGEAFDAESDTQGVLVIHYDSIVYERYWGDFSADRLATVFSVSKSITSLMCGIAVDDGYIHSIDDPVTDYLPELKKKDPMWQKLTIRHLLDMRSGLDFDDTYSLSLKTKDIKRLNAMSKLNYGSNIMAQIRKLKFRCEPGTEYNYDSMTSEVLGIIIERAVGRSYAEYLCEKIWTPLRMESPAYINYDSKKHHTAHAFGGLALTMRDLAKIGRLYLNRGVYDEKRIVSDSWIEQSTAYSQDNEGYHFCWYNTSCIGADEPEFPGYYAMGIRGQVLYVNPYKNLIMVRLGLKDDTYAHIPYLFEQLSISWIED